MRSKSVSLIRVKKRRLEEAHLETGHILLLKNSFDLWLVRNEMRVKGEWRRIKWQISGIIWRWFAQIWLCCQNLIRWLQKIWRIFWVSWIKFKFQIHLSLCQFTWYLLNLSLRNYLICINQCQLFMKLMRSKSIWKSKNIS